jgi:hypothetical protein
VSPAGLGYTFEGMRVIAANWGPCSIGWWISFWLDARDYVDDVAVAEYAVRAHGWPEWVSRMGWLRYVNSHGLTVTTVDEVPLAEEYMYHSGTPYPVPRVTGVLSTVWGAWSL